MRLRAAAIRDGKWDTAKGDALVAKSTAAAYTEPTFALFVREKDRRETSGSMFLFSWPPQSMTVERGSNVGVVPTRHGYVVSENGLQNPTFILQGHFGWRLRTIKAPPALIVAPLAVKRNVYYDQHVSDVWVDAPLTAEDGSESLIEKFLEGKLNLKKNIVTFTQTLDGREAYFALRDLIVYYLEENQKRMAKGKMPMEMVFLDTLHSHRWVVVPKHPTLKRSYDTQGTHPYTLELVGVYDDARPRKRRGDQAWSY